VTARLDPAAFDALTFDCYGTLVDWESGILAAIRPVLAAHGFRMDDEEIHSLYAAFEQRAEAGEYRRYRDVLRAVMQEFSRRLGFQPREREFDCLARSMPDWPPFPDTSRALASLRRRYRLFVLSNVDDDLFALTAPRLGVEMDGIVTAQQLRVYKPSHAFFRDAFARTGVPRERILHVAQSLFHDVAPVAELGLATVWVNRRRGSKGAGATPPAAALPDVEVKDLDELDGLLTAGVA